MFSRSPTSVNSYFQGHLGHACLDKFKGSQGEKHLSKYVSTENLWFFPNYFYLLIRETEEEREGEMSICCSTYLCTHWLILACALTGDRTCNLDIWR